MAKRRVNPNRMELLKLKNQLRTARRGHKLLKDKRDELMRLFLDLVRTTADLRIRVEDLLDKANQEMVLARATMQAAVVESALLTGLPPLQLEVSEVNTMSVISPVFKLPSAGDEGGTDTDAVKLALGSGDLPYGMTSVSGELDQAIDALREVFPLLLELAEKENQAMLMAMEIERTRRRVNSLEYVLIPELLELIVSITMKMEENERGNLTRLMKVKDMIVEARLEQKKQSKPQS
ncbi:MAG: V-type ATP synthase subunit D [Clostridiales bacterium]|jgi:V/A-type H+-transporting ATPase subunit D|nr:V-type ATP synthase subunit D [Bacillota bacterium]NLB08416.1 V-type ATP synthase subunit D [Clostridiales bacterium]